MLLARARWRGGNASPTLGPACPHAWRLAPAPWLPPFAPSAVVATEGEGGDSAFLAAQLTAPHALSPPAPPTCPGKLPLPPPPRSCRVGLALRTAPRRTAEPVRARDLVQAGGVQCKSIAFESGLRRRAVPPGQRGSMCPTHPARTFARPVGLTWAVLVARQVPS